MPVMVMGRRLPKIIERGQIVGSPQQNGRLMQNPQLIPYLAQIFNLSEFRGYLCSTSVKYVSDHSSLASPCSFFEFSLIAQQISLVCLYCSLVSDWVVTVV